MGGLRSGAAALDTRARPCAKNGAGSVRMISAVCAGWAGSAAGTWQLAWCAAGMSLSDDGPRCSPPWASSAPAQCDVCASSTSPAWTAEAAIIENEMMPRRARSSLRSIALMPYYAFAAMSLQLFRLALPLMRKGTRGFAAPSPIRGGSEVYSEPSVVIGAVRAFGVNERIPVDAVHLVGRDELRRVGIEHVVRTHG